MSIPEHKFPNTILPSSNALMQSEIVLPLPRSLSANCRIVSHMSSPTDGIFQNRIQAPIMTPFAHESDPGRKTHGLNALGEEGSYSKSHAKSRRLASLHRGILNVDDSCRSTTPSALPITPKIVMFSTSFNQNRKTGKVGKHHTQQGASDETPDEPRSNHRQRHKKRMHDKVDSTNSKYQEMSSLIPCYSSYSVGLDSASVVVKQSPKDPAIAISENRTDVHFIWPSLHVNGGIDNIGLPQTLQVPRYSDLHSPGRTNNSSRPYPNITSYNSLTKSSGACAITPLSDGNCATNNKVSSQETNSQLLTSFSTSTADYVNGHNHTPREELNGGCTCAHFQRSSQMKPGDNVCKILLTNSIEGSKTERGLALRVRLNHKALIGKGSYGMVFQAMVLDTNRIIAVKEIPIGNSLRRLHHPHESDSNCRHSCGPGASGELEGGTTGASSIPVDIVKMPSSSLNNNSADFQSKLDLVWRELSLMRELDHPNIVKYLGEEIDDSYIRIYMEYVSGGSISSLLRTFDSFQESQVANFTRQILQAVTYLHSKGIAHYDLKGDNLLVDPSGTLKLADFGTAQEINSKKGVTKIAGTAYFIAPEVVIQGTSDFKSDIWSVGCCVIEMLTGVAPLSHLATKYSVLMMLAESTDDIFKHYIPKEHNWSPDVVDFLMQCLQWDPAKRPSAAQLLTHRWLMHPPTDVGTTTNNNSPTVTTQITARMYPPPRPFCCQAVRVSNSPIRKRIIFLLRFLLSC
ncbi:unnamed protein product [Phytomonas sp. Hart1]|nr:unnamed protein product [Phytomonas sp. Hart1]|eukprot:CCW67857.1 unnamed protein product [Phytomonas sp. isolate Hart1]